MDQSTTRPLVVVESGRPAAREAMVRSLPTLRARHPELPVVLELPTAAARRHDDLLDGCTVVPPFSSDALAAVVRGVVPA